MPIHVDIFIIIIERLKYFMLVYVYKYVLLSPVSFIIILE